MCMCVFVHTHVCPREVGSDETEERWGGETEEEDGLIRQIEQNEKNLLNVDTRYEEFLYYSCSFSLHMKLYKNSAIHKKLQKVSKMDLEVKSDFSIASWLFSSSFYPLLYFFSFYS